MNEPKEFFIDSEENTSFGLTYVSSNQMCKGDPRFIHTIEYSAFEKAKNERNKLDAEFPKIIVQIAKLEQERDEFSKLAVDRALEADQARLLFIEASVEIRKLKSMLAGTLTHTRGCTYDNAPGDEGDFCTCGLAKRRKLCK